ncbi:SYNAPTONEMAL COMPLEX PROTEIN-RELATED [Salix viminalis]|uniref:SYNAPTONEMAL COMPLEX PROTEIN-RELATED n=1 Tax=Salix viminalis TaxID=40686 RepID=A0A9Q0UI92_SALVM|nr:SYNAPTONEMAL COMPLEX PROTEIN-RELATED [Salix viminalis]
MKTLDQFKSLSAPAKNFSFNSRPSMDSTTSGSFANLKITAEKLVKEQASVKTDLEMANTKLKKSLEHIHVLEDKLQNAFNENAKLKVKQKEDEKLWKGLESKFSSTKTLCDQLTETLQHLAGQVQDAEKDKEFFEGKLSASSNSIDNLNQQLNDLSLKLGSAEETIRTRERELQELEIKKEEREKIYTEELRQTAILIEEKDAMLKKFEAIVAANRLATEDLNSKLEEMNHELRLKGDKINSLVIAQEKLVKEKSDHQSRSNDFANRLAMSLQEIKNLEGFLHVLAAQLVELDKQSLTFTTKFDQLNSLYDSCFKLAQQERELAVKHVQRQYDQLHDQFLSVKSEKDAMKLKEYSVSSVKMRAPGGAKRSHNSLGNSQNEKKDSLCLKATQTPVTKLLKKVETPNSGSVMVIPKHHKKVTHHEYEVETNNGRTITKRRKTKSTVMFEDPRKHGRTNTPKARTPRSVAKGHKREGQSHPSTIDDLFLEGSLNPYADDPYAFG